MKKNLIAVLLSLLLCGMLVCAAGEPLTGKTAEEIVADMGIGWNLGNTFDATGYKAGNIYAQEQSWGNPIVDQALMQRVKDAGFTTIRIPVTWYRNLSKDGSYTIDPAFIARVKEVVDYAYACDLYVIINMHHESWINVKNLDTNYVKIGEQLGAMWKQVAEAFADYDQHLIFEGMNEPRMAGTSLEWNGNKAGFDAVNYLNQVFVDAVRLEPKGNNAERCLMVPGYAASSSYAAMAAVKLPTVNGETAKNLIVSVHCYSPYDFCLSDNQKTFDPNNNAHTSSIDSVFSNVYSIFLARGIPVIIGETGATNTGNNHADRANWAYYMGSKAAQYGVPIIIWDNGAGGSSGGECHIWIRRKVNEKIASQSTPIPYPEVVEQLMAGAASVPWGSVRPDLTNVISLVGGDVIWSNENGLKSTAQWDVSYIQLPSTAEWYADGSRIALVYTGIGTPKIILNSEELGVKWIQVDAASTEKLDDKKVAWFNAETVIKACEKAGVTDLTKLWNFSIITINGNITSYEISHVGE